MAEVRFYPELRRLQKVANQRIRELERKAPGAPALSGIQATLEMMGVKKGSAMGRRFSETGKGEWKAVEREMSILRKFISGESTISRYKGRMSRVFSEADKRFDLRGHGVSEEDYYKMWSNAPDKSERKFGSEIYIEMLERVTELNSSRRLEDQITIDEMMNRINSAENVSEAYRQLGISYDWEDTEDDYF